MHKYFINLIWTLFMANYTVHFLHLNRTSIYNRLNELEMQWNSSIRIISYLRFSKKRGCNIDGIFK